MSDMARHCLAFRQPKGDETLEEWEDAYAVDPVGQRLAVADGTTDSVYAKVWAELLVNRFVAAKGDAEDWSGWLLGARDAWAAQFCGREIPYHAVKKFQKGSFATFLGVVLKTFEGLPCHWHAVAVGDTCLFHTRDAVLQKSFPVERSEQFGNTPALVCSRGSFAEMTHGHATSQTALPGDRLWLMTDALAHWALARQEAGDSPWEELQRFLTPQTTPAEFAAWIERLREHQGLRDDDITLLTLTV